MALKGQHLNNNLDRPLSMGYVIPLGNSSVMETSSSSNLLLECNEDLITIGLHEVNVDDNNKPSRPRKTIQSTL